MVGWSLAIWLVGLIGYWLFSSVIKVLVVWVNRLLVVQLGDYSFGWLS